MNRILSLVRRCVEDYEMISLKTAWPLACRGARTP